jgi:RpiB/LacA/LacB family sugar-phosphate isomerase
MVLKIVERRSWTRRMIMWIMRIQESRQRNGRAENRKGILICGSGVGVCIAANRVKGVRCGLGLNKKQVVDARRHDDMNVLALAADYVSFEEARGMVEAFLKTEFDGEEKHKRRIEKLDSA